MTAIQIITLTERDLINSFLMVNWAKSCQRKNPIPFAYDRLDKYKIWTSAGLITILVGVLLQLCFMMDKKASPATFYAGSIVSFAIVSAGFICAIIGLVYLQSCHLATILNQLRKVLQHSWTSFLRSTEDELRSDAKKELVQEAMSVLQTQINHGLDSVAFLDARENYKRKHEICYKFYLADKRWNQYFDEAQMKLEEALKK